MELPNRIIIYGLRINYNNINDTNINKILTLNIDDKIININNEIDIDNLEKKYDEFYEKYSPEYSISALGLDDNNNITEYDVNNNLNEIDKLLLRLYMKKNWDIYKASLISLASKAAGGK